MQPRITLMHMIENSKRNQLICDCTQSTDPHRASVNNKFFAETNVDYDLSNSLLALE